MNKQEIFPLYVGKCKVKTPYGIGGYYAVDTVMGGIELIYNDEGHPNNLNCFYSDCQLILKPLSKMSERELYELFETIGRIPTDLKIKGVWTVMNERNFKEFTLKQSIELTLWLIQHGYALSDEWFTNGIATETGKGER